MRITCLARDLSQTLRRLLHAMPSGVTTLPMLRFALMETLDETHVRFAATDLELGVICRVEATVVEAGSMAIPVHALLAKVGVLSPEAVVTLHTVDTSSEGGQTSKTLLLLDEEEIGTCMDAADYPPVRFPTATALAVSGPVALFKGILAQVLFAAANDPAEPLLSAVWLHCQGKRITFAASDGARCAIRSVAVTTNVQDMLCLASAQALARIASELPGEGQAELRVDQKKSLLAVRCAHSEWVLRLTDPEAGPFFGRVSQIRQYTDGGRARPFEPFLPSQYHTLVVVKARALRKAVRRKEGTLLACQLVENEQGRMVLELSLFCAGEIVTSMLPVQVWGPAFPRIWLNPRFLVDALQPSWREDTLVLGFGQQQAYADTVVLRWMGPEEVRTDYTYAFRPLAPHRIARDARLRLHIPEALHSLISDQAQCAWQAGEDEAVVRLRIDVLYRIGCMEHYGLLALAAPAVQEAAERVRQIAEKPEDVRREIPTRHFDEVAELLSLAAFAPGGCTLDLPQGRTIVRLAFDVNNIRVLRDRITESAEHAAPLASEP